jgi:hypothetical protein
VAISIEHCIFCGRYVHKNKIANEGYIIGCQSCGAIYGIALQPTDDPTDEVIAAIEFIKPPERPTKH